jgi:hypothetical protein
MNIFELNVLASPIGGIVGGIAAAKGLSSTWVAIAGIIGFGVGAVLYPMVFLVTMGLAKMTVDLSRPPAKQIDVLELVLILPIIGMPFISAWMAHWIVGLVLR